MKNNKFDIINYDIPKFDVDVKFTYHTYDEQSEDISPINDFDINLKLDNANMFLSNRITIQLNDLRDRLRFDSNISFLKNINQVIVSEIQGLQNKNLNSFTINDVKAIEYFNSNLKFDDKSISFISGLNDKYRKRVLEAYDLNTDLYSNLSQFNQRKELTSVNMPPALIEGLESVIIFTIMFIFQEYLVILVNLDLYFLCLQFFSYLKYFTKNYLGSK